MIVQFLEGLFGKIELALAGFIQFAEGGLFEQVVLVEADGPKFLAVED